MKMTSYDIHTRQAAALIKVLHNQGEQLAEIAHKLNANSFKNSAGTTFEVLEVEQILNRMEEIDQFNNETASLPK